MVALTDSAAARKLLLHGAVGARGVAADAAVGMSFGLDGLWQLIAGLFSGLVHLLFLPFQALAAAVAHCFEALGHAIQGLFAGIVAGLGSMAHLLILPFEMLWRGIQAAVTGVGHGFDGMWHAYRTSSPTRRRPRRRGPWAHPTAAGGIGSGFEGLWQNMLAFFANFLATLAGAAHELVHPFQAFWKWIQTAVADAATGISFGFDGFWQHIRSFFASVLATLAGAAHDLVQPFEAFCKWLKTAAAAAADAAADISFRLDGLWPLVKRLYASLLATLASAAHELVPVLESFWRWLRAAAAAALPYVLVIAAVLCVVALVWLTWPFLFSAAPLIGLALVGVVGCFGLLLLAAAVLIGRALVYAVCYSGVFLLVAAKVVGKVLDRVLPACARCYDRVMTTTMSAPDAAGMDISRAAYESLPELYSQILRSAGPIVAAAVFCSHPVALACAAPVAALFLFRALDKRLPQSEPCVLPAAAYPDIVTDVSDSCSIGQHHVSEDDDVSSSSSIHPYGGDHVTLTIRQRIHLRIHVVNVCPVCALANDN
uniref:Uncharacterized protein n=1 Tax=Oryza punctata TaxID=4537 RepID=A0A0E0JI20_ORYPU